MRLLVLQENIDDMIKSLLYKEWIKTRFVVLLLCVGLAAFLSYDFLVLSKNVQLMGYSFLWEHAVGKNSIIVENLTLLPVICGILLSISQYVPESNRKCLKLTLHLPMPQHLTIAVTQAYGVAVLVVLFGVQALLVGLFLNHYLVADLVSRIVFSLMTWYCAGLCSYVWMSAVCLEPDWKMKVFEGVLMCALLSIYYMSSAAMAYRYAVIPLFVVTVLLASVLIHYSVRRFKDGN